MKNRIRRILARLLGNEPRDRAYLGVILACNVALVANVLGQATATARTVCTQTTLADGTALVTCKVVR